MVYSSSPLNVHEFSTELIVVVLVNNFDRYPLNPEPKPFALPIVPGSPSTLSIALQATATITNWDTRTPYSTTKLGTGEYDLWSLSSGPVRSTTKRQQNCYLWPL